MVLAFIWCSRYLSWLGSPNVKRLLTCSLVIYWYTTEKCIGFNTCLWICYLLMVYTFLWFSFHPHKMSTTSESNWPDARWWLWAPDSLLTPILNLRIAWNTNLPNAYHSQFWTKWPLPWIPCIFAKHLWGSGWGGGLISSGFCLYVNPW